MKSYRNHLWESLCRTAYNKGYNILHYAKSYNYINRIERNIWYFIKRFSFIRIARFYSIIGSAFFLPVFRLLLSGCFGLRTGLFVRLMFPTIPLPNTKPSLFSSDLTQCTRDAVCNMDISFIQRYIFAATEKLSDLKCIFFGHTIVFL